MRCPAPRSSPYSGREQHAPPARTDRPPGPQLPHPPHPRCSPSPVPQRTQPSLSPRQPSQGRQFYALPYAYPDALLRRGLRFDHPPVGASSAGAGGAELFREEREKKGSGNGVGPSVGSFCSREGGCVPPRRDISTKGPGAAGRAAVLRAEVGSSRSASHGKRHGLCSVALLSCAVGLEAAGAATVRSAIKGALCGCVSFCKQESCGAAPFAALLAVPCPRCPRTPPSQRPRVRCHPMHSPEDGDNGVRSPTLTPGGGSWSRTRATHQEDFIALLAQQNRSSDRGSTRPLPSTETSPHVHRDAVRGVCCTDITRNPRATAAELCLADRSSARGGMQACRGRS